MDASLIAIAAAAVSAISFVAIPMFYRTVVETNKVHIVQRKKNTTSYGTGKEDGNVYYRWPSWMPVIGINRIVLAVSNLDLDLDGYVAYDKDRLPFELDLVAFFRIADTNKAAERVDSHEKLVHQLETILKGAARKILASHDIHTIMTERSTFGEQFTDEVKAEVANWGVEPVKNMELMDIRDVSGSHVIANIMAKKSSHIEMESRIEVSNNKQAAQTAEIEAQRQIDIATQEADQQVGLRTTAKDQAVGIAKQQSQQAISEEEAVTAKKGVEVARVREVGQAEIDKDTAVVKAGQDRDVAVLKADGDLEATKRSAEGIKAQGEAKADAEKAMLMAPVEAQIALADKIGTDQGYQNYLLGVERIKADQAVGTAQAQALASANVKVIATGGTPSEGIASLGQLFTPKGGVAVGSALEGLGSTEEGAQVLAGFAKLAGLIGAANNGAAKQPAAN